MDDELPIVKVDVLDLRASTPPLSATTDIPIVETKPDSQKAFDGEKTGVDDKTGDKPAPEEGKTAEDSDPPADETPPTDESSGDPDKAKKPPKGVQKALDRLTKEREEQRERAEAAERRLDKALERIEKVAPKPDVPQEPKREDFDEPEAYYDAKAEWKAAQIVEQRMADKQQKDFEAEVQRETERTRAAYDARRVKVAEELPDFDEVASRDDVQIPIPCVHAILLHEQGPKIQYYLGQHPEEAKALFALNPIQAVGRIAEIGIEVAKVTRAVSKAPEPIKPLGSRESAAKDPSEMTMDEYADYARQRDENARKARSRR